jgi:mono/diheme cytochrome c family protein
MRPIASVVSAGVFLSALLVVGTRPASTAKPLDGRAIFRYDTFGDEQLWTNVLRMHEVLPQVDPQTALAVGLKVDREALPAAVIAAIKAGDVDLTDPRLTVTLLGLDAIVGVVGKADGSGTLTSVGITCALCHSTVDDSVAPGIGARLDGWANGDLNVGAILALSPFFASDAAFVNELRGWGPGKYDPRHHVFDGEKVETRFPDTLPVVIPPAYGLKGVGLETFTGDGPVSYWNAYVGISQMGGKGNFHDPRIDLSITQSPDLITAKLPALLAYQLSLAAPKPPRGSFDPRAAARGAAVFREQGRCASCHPAPLYTDVGSPEAPVLHAPGETGTETQYASRSATKQYRATPLRALWQHPPYFHDGSARDLAAVVEHYNDVLQLHLSAADRQDLVEYLKSL